MPKKYYMEKTVEFEQLDCALRDVNGAQQKSLGHRTSESH